MREHIEGLEVQLDAQRDNKLIEHLGFGCLYSIGGKFSRVLGRFVHSSNFSYRLLFFSGSSCVNTILGPVSS